MHQAHGVGRRQALGRLPADPHHLGHRQHAVALEPLVQRLSLEKGHGNEGHAAVLAHLQDGHDVIVLDGGGGFGLAQEALTGGFTGGQARQHGLDGQLALELRVLGLEHHAHAAGAEHLEDTKTAEPADLVWPFRRGQEVVVRPRVLVGIIIASAGRGAAQLGGRKLGTPGAAVPPCNATAGPGGSVRSSSAGCPGAAWLGPNAVRPFAGTTSAFPQPGHLTCLPATSSLTLSGLPQAAHAKEIIAKP